MIEDTRRAFETAAEQESAKAQATLAARVAETSVVIAKKLAERALRIHALTAMFAGAVVFGAICMTAGLHAARGGEPFGWELDVAHARGGSVASWVLGAPAGWMAFALVLPLLAHGVHAGWTRAHEGDASRLDQGLGWGMVAGCVAAAAASVATLVRMLT